MDYIPCRTTGRLPVPETSDFEFDVFLSHSAKDKAAVREIAQRLQGDGLRVWFDELEIKPGDSIPAKIEEGLDHSRVLVLCMSANAFGSDWAQLEAGTFRFRDPLNQARRFIPVRLDDSPIKGSLAQFLYISWSPVVREQEYSKLFEACRPPAKPAPVKAADASEQVAEITIQLNSKSVDILQYAFSPDGKRALTGSKDRNIRLWDLETGVCLREFEGHSAEETCVAWSLDQRLAISGSQDRTMLVWDVDTGRCLRVFGGHFGSVNAVAWSADQRHALSGSGDNSVRLWDVETARCLQVFEGHTERINDVAYGADQSQILSASHDRTIRVWNLKTGRCMHILEGHSGAVWRVVCSPGGELALSAGSTVDPTVRLWDVKTGRFLRAFEGHKGGVLDLAWHNDEGVALSCDEHGEVRLWDVDTGRCLSVLRGHPSDARGVAWSFDKRHAFSGAWHGSVCLWDLSEFVTQTRAPKYAAPALQPAPDQVQYTNAKVLLVGESGVGKTALSKRLALNNWQPSDSTVGAWATQWKLLMAPERDIEREIWLWDFGGQADQRLIHQLYMEDTALAVLVFDGQKEDVFETLAQWDRDLTRASRKEFAKLLVAGRVDAGGLRVSRSEVEKFSIEHKFLNFLETSAKQNLGCEELKQAIVGGISWDELPCRTTKLLFKRLKEEIIRLKDEGRVLMRFNELRETLQLRLSGEFKRFADHELRAVLTLLAGPGVVWELAFGSWVLLQPERINAYAQAVIRALQADEHQRGCLMEERVLKGDLPYESAIPRLAGDEERFVLLAMHQTLVERSLCLRQMTAKGNLLVFPSYYRRERPEQIRFPAVLVNYRFTGFLDEIYATLVVRLNHSDAFEQDQLWRYAADFKTKSGKRLGIKLNRSSPGVGDLDVYFEASISDGEKIIFSKYIHEHLLQYARDVTRVRHYACPHCGTPVGNRVEAMQRLNSWLHGRSQQLGRLRILRRKDQLPSIICVVCETKRVPLWDEFEQCFASAETRQLVRDMQDEVNIELDNESKERALVGEVISTVALAAQISREFNVSDHGIDMEIEFKDDANEATGAKLYLQLKSGDSYTRTRKHDGTEIFTIKGGRHARYWMAQAFPVMLVIRNSEGEVRWMEIRDWLKRESDRGRKPVKQIVFEGERFDVMSVRRWRETLLSRPLS
jgi:small GTP-binding protein